MIVNEKTGNIFYDETLPKKEGLGANKGKICIDWDNSIGLTFSMLYLNELYKFEVCKFLKSKHSKLILKNEQGDALKPIGIDSVQKCNIGILIGKITKDFKFNIGDTIKDSSKDFIILDRLFVEEEYYGKIFNRKYYICKCNICEYNFRIIEGDLFNINRHCGNCGRKLKYMKGSCIAITHPHLLNVFDNPNDAYNYSYGSGRKVNLKCPNCGKIKYTSLNSMGTNKFNCDECGDGISYPNKFMTSILKQLGVEFVREYSPKYLNSKKSDFYIPCYSLIIEMDGELGHKDGKAFSGIESELEELIAIDKWKDEQHLLHGVKTIRINCFESNMEYIRENILKSELINYFDLDFIDWRNADEYSLKSLVIEAWNLWNNKHPSQTTKDISELIGVNRRTLNGWLNKGQKLGKCNYNPIEEANKSYFDLKYIEVIKDNLSLGVYEGVSKLAEKSKEIFNIKFSENGISKSCIGRIKSHKGFMFKYITKEEYQERIKNSIN